MSKYYLTKDELYHHGIQGQKWGLRRWQNEDGSLTEAGRKHYGYGDSRYDTKQNFKNAKSELQKARLNELSAFKRASSGSFNSINDRIELMFAPVDGDDEFSDNVVMAWKGADCHD